MKIYLLTGILATLLFTGCNKTLDDQGTTSQLSAEKCPIHGVVFNIGPGKLSPKMSVSWKKEVYAAMAKYPYVRRDSYNTAIMKYCKKCEYEVDRASK